MKEKKIIIPIINYYGRAEINISGDLDCIIGMFPYKSGLKISSEMGYKIFNSRDVMGIFNATIRKQSIDESGHRINFSSEKFKLNEKIIIEVECYAGDRKVKKEVRLILRYD